MQGIYSPNTVEFLDLSLILHANLGPNFTRAPRNFPIAHVMGKLATSWGSYEETAVIKFGLFPTCC